MTEIRRFSEKIQARVDYTGGGHRLDPSEDQKEEKVGKWRPKENAC